MEEKINPRSVVEFEESILNPDNTGEIRYTVDSSIEASVKYDYLCENFGKNKVESLFKEKEINFLDLHRYDLFLEIKEELKQK